MQDNKIILGTVQFGLDYGINNKAGKPTYDTIKEILDLAFKKNINFLDTAEAYGDSQEKIGNYHLRSLNVFKVITKFSPSRKDLPNNISERIKCNLNTLKVESLYSYMFHSYTDFKTYFSLFKKELLSMKNEGLIKKIGVSLNSNEEIEDVLNCNHIDLIQLPFNLLDNNNQRKKTLIKAKEKGVEIHTRSVFLQGLFFKNSKSLKGNLKCLEVYLKQLHKLTSENLKINDIALNYVINQPFIDAVLIGVDNPNQLNLNIESINKYIPKSILEYINSIKVKEKELLNPYNWNQ